MKFIPLKLKDAFLIEPDLIEDDRGFFARTFCQVEFLKNGLTVPLEQCSISYNHKKGTVRGMHYQIAPYGEVKVVRCTQGAIYDVIVDLRPESPTFKKWEGIELSAQNRKMLYIPEGFAHGFQTLQDATEVFYQISTSYIPEAARGARWNDSQFSIEWPMTPSVISEKDIRYADFIS